jgi:hypothetical protein
MATIGVDLACRRVAGDLHARPGLDTGAKLTIVLL